MRTINGQKLAGLDLKMCTLHTFSSLVYSLLPKDNLFKNIIVQLNDFFTFSPQNVALL